MLLTREAVVKALSEQLKKGLKPLVPNKGFRKYLKIEKGSARFDEKQGSARFDEKQVSHEARSDGKWMLKTNTDLSPEKAAVKYKELGRAERVFRDVKSLLDTRPTFQRKMRFQAIPLAT